MFEGAGEKSLRLHEHYRQVAAECGCHFFDAGCVIRTSDIDGVHLGAGEHGKLATALAAQVRHIFADLDCT
jgi:hypothetical protein